MEFNFEEKFIFGHQNFLNCCFKVQFGSGSKSNCVLVDCSGVLYFPVSSDSGDVAIHRADLKEILNKNITITSAYHVEHNERSYLFLACDAEEGGGYRLITYCTSHYDIYSKDKDLVAWQTLELPFKIMDAKSLTDENQNSIILLCGSDKRTHIYSLDAQCIVVRRKKSHAFRNSVIDQLLLFEDKGYECLTSALPIRLFINQIHSIENYSVSDILLGYSNGIIIWYHETILLQISHNEFDFIQEIPLFQGKSNSPNSVDSNTNKSDLLLPRKSRSANDLLKGFEEILSMNNPNDEFEGRSKSSDQLTNLDITLPLTSITEEESEDESLPGLPSIPPVYIPEIITTEVPHIERKILFFDGVLSCCCFYDIPFSNNSQSNDSSQRNLQRLSLQSKVQLSIPCIVVGLANGSTLLVQFSDVENPHAILPKSYSHGGVRAISQEFISNNRCRDIDGTIILVKYETALRENQIPNSFNIDTEKKLNDPCFRILWQTQLAFPVIGLSFGQLIHRSRSQNELSRNSNGKFNAENKDINENKSSEILSDQLAIVTTKSFHLFSLSFFNNLDTDQIDNIDQLVEKFSSYLY